MKEACVRASVSLIAIGLSLAAAALSTAGCHNPPPPRVTIPSTSGGNPYSTYERDEVKPLPPSARSTSETPQPAPDPSRPPVGLTEVVPQQPTVSQAYLDAYDRVGRPRLLVIADHPDQPAHGLVAEDYDLIQRLVRECVAGGGQVAVVPPNIVHDRLSTRQLDDLQAGRTTALANIGTTLRADVLIEVKTAAAGDQTQFTANARNTRDGAQIATASATIPSAAPRRQVDFAGRLLGERMVDALADTWDRFARDLSKSPSSASSSAARTAPAAPTAPTPPAAPTPPTPPPAPTPPVAPTAPTPPVPPTPPTPPSSPTPPPPPPPAPAPASSATQPPGPS
jgi:hypothetical protein